MTGGRVSAMVPSKSESDLVCWRRVHIHNCQDRPRKWCIFKIHRVLDKIKTQYILQRFKVPAESGQSEDQPEPDILEPKTSEGHSEAA